MRAREEADDGVVFIRPDVEGAGGRARAARPDEAFLDFGESSETDLTVCERWNEGQ